VISLSNSVNHRSFQRTICSKIRLRRGTVQAGHGGTKVSDGVEAEVPQETHGGKMDFLSDYSSGIAISSTSDNDASKSCSASFREGAYSMVPGSGDLLPDASSDTSSRNDQHLVVAAQSGCGTAFNELWNLYSRRIYKTVFNITKNAQDAEDATQDSFLRAYLAFESFEGRASFYSWLTRIAINSALGILRKRRSRPEISLNPMRQWDDEGAPVEFTDSAPDPEQTCARYQRFAKLMQAIGKLPANLRVAVEVYITEDCSVQEVAERINISEAAVKSRLYRARKRLGFLTKAGYRPTTKAPELALSEIAINPVPMRHHAIG
jgi:RNA polymerase sigma-70 factor, ECF subfamily